MMSRARRIRQHASEILKVKDDRAPWTWMIATGLSTLTPLLAGIMRGEASLAIFGALTGYFVGLTDNRGSLAHRLLTAVTTVGVCWLAFIAGIALQNSVTGFLLLSGIMVYLLGLLGGRGGELERLLLFAGIDFFVSRYARSVTSPLLPQISFYFAIALVTVLVVILISRLLIRNTQGEFVPLAQAMRHFFTTDRRRHFYAITYTSAVLFAIVCVDYFKIDRGYWTVITALLMLKPDRKTSLHRIVQRILGTTLGVCLGELLIIYQPPLAFLLLSAGLCATVVPYVWNRNYWLVSFAATTLVISLLSIAQYGHIDPSLTILRLKATLSGCLISAVVIFTFRWLEKEFLPAEKTI